MAHTKRLLVAFDADAPGSTSTDFLIPRLVDGQNVLYGLTSSSIHALGMLVYVGRSVTENDLFARLVDSGAAIDNVEETLAGLRTYVESLQPLRLGDVVRLKTRGVKDVSLEIVSSSPSALAPHRRVP